jgi:hypothetical protein
MKPKFFNNPKLFLYPSQLCKNPLYSPIFPELVLLSKKGKFNLHILVEWQRRSPRHKFVRRLVRHHNLKSLHCQINTLHQILFQTGYSNQSLSVFHTPYEEEYTFSIIYYYWYLGQ